MTPTCLSPTECWETSVRLYHSVMFAIAIVCLYFIISTWRTVRNHFKEKREYERLDHITRRLETDEFTI